MKATQWQITVAVPNVSVRRFTGWSRDEVHAKAMKYIDGVMQNRYAFCVSAIEKV